MIPILPLMSGAGMLAQRQSVIQEGIMDGSVRSLEAVLLDVSAETVFKDGGGRTVAPATIRQWHYSKTERIYEDLGVVPLLPQSLRDELTACLRSLLGPYIVDGEIGSGFFCFLGGHKTIDFVNLIGGVARATGILGPQDAGQTLRQWSEGTDVRYQTHMVLTGATVDQPFAIGDGFQVDRLLNTTTLGGRDILPNYARELFGSVAFPNSAILSVDCEAGPAFIHTKAAQQKHSRTSPIGPVRVESPDRFAVALSLVTNHPISCLIHWTTCQDAKAFGLASRSRAFAGTEGDGLKQSLTRRKIEEAIDLHIKFFNEWTMDRSLSIAIARWARSKEFKNPADQLIDLRIALEALFLPGQAQGELAFRLAVRGAWYMGATTEDRKQIRDLIATAYRRASTAIHGGKVGDYMGNVNLIGSVQHLCREAILKRLADDDQPDWNDLILGGKLTD